MKLYWRMRTRKQSAQWDADRGRDTESWNLRKLGTFRGNRWGTTIFSKILDNVCSTLFIGNSQPTDSSSEDLTVYLKMFRQCFLTHSIPQGAANEILEGRSFVLECYYLMLSAPLYSTLVTSARFDVHPMWLLPLPPLVPAGCQDRAPWLRRRRCRCARPACRWRTSIHFFLDSNTQRCPGSRSGWNLLNRQRTRTDQSWKWQTWGLFKHSWWNWPSTKMRPWWTVTPCALRQFCKEALGSQMFLAML